MDKQNGFLQGIQLYIGIAIVAVVLGLAYGIYHKISVLQEENKTLTENNKILKDNLSEAEALNKEAAQTIKQLQADAEASNKALDDLRIQKQRDNKELSTLRGVIGKQRGNPQFDGTVSPVLKNTIDSIQTSRKGVKK